MDGFYDAVMHAPEHCGIACCSCAAAAAAVVLHQGKSIGHSSGKPPWQLARCQVDPPSILMVGCQQWITFFHIDGCCC
jgi:hypothetical protein